MRILFAHTTCPAQFRRLAPALAADGHEVVYLHRSREWHAPMPEGYRCVQYTPSRSTEEAALHPYLRRFEAVVLEGQAAYRQAMELKREGFSPDLIISHAGFGSGLYLSDAFPQARRIGLFEWYYNAFGSDVDFLQHGQVSEEQQLRLRTWNAQLLLELSHCDETVVPTQWQRDQFPEPFRSQLRVIHEGIDTETLGQLRSRPPARPAVLPPDPGIEVVTYVSRGFEPYRGFPQAAEALALLQAQRPKVHLLIAGSDEVAYGAPRSDGRSWRRWACDSFRFDPNRTHWLGAVQTADYQALLAHSQAHLYLTVPFVLSWSLLEAMAAGCPIVASATAPVLEVIAHQQQGLLVPFHEPAIIAARLSQLLDQPEQANQLGTSAQYRVQELSASKGLTNWRNLLGSLRPQALQTVIKSTLFN